MNLQEPASPPGWLLLVDPQRDQSLLLLGWHAVIVLVCLYVAFRVRGQQGGATIMSGVGLILFCQLALLIGYLAPSGASTFPFYTTLLFFGATVMGYALIGVGVMQPHQIATFAVSRLSTWLGVVLFTVVCIDVSLIADRLAGSAGIGVTSGIQQFAHVAAMLLLIPVIAARQEQHRTLNRKAAADQRQLDAMLSMFASVRHDLNNDMQVVVGNAELANVLLASNGCIQEPVDKITDAATMAIERIEQLSVFSATAATAPGAVDLNAAIREDVSRLTTEVPTSVTLRLELEHIPIRVMADRYLLGLSISYLIKQAVKTMDRGGEIIVRTAYETPDNAEPRKALVNADVLISRTLDNVVKSDRIADAGKLADNTDLLKIGLATTGALVERCGAISVRHFMADNESMIKMVFVTERLEASTTESTPHAGGNSQTASLAGTRAGRG